MACPNAQAPTRMRQHPHMSFVTHWDDVELRRFEGGAVRGRFQDLGRAAGSGDGASVARRVLDPGARSSPAHSHARDEEFFFVLAGSGLSWQEGVTHEIGPGDCLLHKPGGPAHTVIAGDEGIDVLAFGPRTLPALTHAPRAGVFLAGPWLVADDAGPERPFLREPLDLGGEPGSRPSTTIHVSDGLAGKMDRGRTRVTWSDVGRATGSTTTGLRHGTIAPGTDGPPLHCHSAETEIFVVLEGGGTLLLGDEEHPVRRGNVVGRPPGTGVPHQFRAGDDGLAFLAWGTREPNDMCWYPRSSKIAFRGLGVRVRVQALEYWDGEE